MPTRCVDRRRDRSSRYCRRLAGLLAGAIIALIGCGRPAPRPPGDVVLILLDTLRVDHLGFLGHEVERAPFLASQARAGVVFDRAYSTSSWTAPSTASVFTGLYPLRHGVTEGFFAHQQRMQTLSKEGHATLPLNRLPLDVQTLAERFRAGGYRTFGAATNINIGAALGFDRGFDRFRHAHHESAGDLFRQLRPWIEEMRASPQPFFLYLHLNDLHGPYEKRKPWYRPQADPQADLIAAYDSQIPYVDAELQRFAARAGWGAGTIVAIVSDHGEAFGEHGFQRHDGGLNQELTHVLFSVRGPGIAPRRIPENVSLVDVMPTLLALAGLPVPAGGDGVSLASLIRGDDADLASHLAARTLFGHRVATLDGRERRWWAAMHGPWKLIEDGAARTLFDLDADVAERDDRSASEPERTAALSASLDEFRRTASRQDGPNVDVPLDRRLLEQLRELGYVEGPASAP